MFPKFILTILNICEALSCYKLSSKHIVFFTHNFPENHPNASLLLTCLWFAMVYLFTFTSNWDPLNPSFVGLLSHQVGGLSMFQHTCQSPDTLIASFIRESTCQNRNLSVFFSVSPINAAANQAQGGYAHAASADIRRTDLSLSLFISCLACNHPVSARAAA